MAQMKTWRQVIEGIEVDVLEFDETVESVEKAARLSNTPAFQIVKTILLRARDEYIIALVRGDKRVDLEKAAKLLGEHVELAKPREVRAVLGVEPGAISPLSPSVKELRVIADPSLKELDNIICGGGSIYRLYRVKTVDLLNYLRPEFFDVFS